MIQLRSFRLRIALLSAALAGGALIGFGAVSWWLIYTAKVDRLDAELRNQLVRSARPIPPDRWQFFAASLPPAFGVTTDIPILLWVTDSYGNTLYRSNDWSDHLKLDIPSETPVPPSPLSLDHTPFDRRRFRFDRLPDRPPPLPEILNIPHLVFGESVSPRFQLNRSRSPLTSLPSIKRWL
jgi:hypothetical protein